MPRGQRGDGDDAVRRDTEELLRERHDDADDHWPSCAELLFAIPALAVACAAASTAWGNVPGPWPVVGLLLRVELSRAAWQRVGLRPASWSR